MEPDHDNSLFPLYILARGGGEPMINDVQKEAIRTLGALAVHGNEQARSVLYRLWRVPGYHILLREMIGVYLGIRTSTNS
ncbi:MAG: hypothetical protein OS112_09575 [Methanoregula sp.]|nr:MAG: hypothetical protein OS112_09575 [Methanoregula sp.]